MTRGARYPLVVHLLFAGIFLVGWAEMSIVGLLELIAGRLESRVERVAVVVTLYSLSFSVLAPAVVVAIRRFHPRRVLPGLMAVIALANLACAVSTSVAMMAVSRVLLAAASGAFAATTLGAVVRLVPPSLSGRVISYILVGFGGALVLGVPCSVFVADLTDWRVSFLVIAGVSALLSLLLVVSARTPGPSGADGEAVGHSLFTRLRWLPLSAHLSQSVTFFWICGHSVVFTYLAFLLVDRIGVPLRDVSIVFLVLGISCLIGAHLGGILTDRFGALRTASGALLLHAGILAGAHRFLASLPDAIVFAALWGFASWLSTPAIQTFIARKSGRLTDVMLGLNNSVLHLGIACGTWMGAGLLDQELAVFFELAAGLVTVGALIALMMLCFGGETPRVRPSE